MGTIIMKGYAEKKFEPEIMEFEIEFTKESEDATHAMDYVERQCENFLSELEKVGIEPEQVIVDDEGVSSYRFDSDNQKSASRKIRFKLNVDSKERSYICHLIKKMEKDICYDISYELEDTQSIMKELIEEAVANSREKAELAVGALGKRIVGVKSINTDEYQSRNLAKSVTLDILNEAIPEDFISDTPLADRAALPKITKNHEIKIEWIMED